MKESIWRTKLIAMFRKSRRTEKDFIWAMDAKFKAGFPDLYILINGRAIHYELKVSDTYKEDWTFDAIIKRFFDPLQVTVLNAIAAAGGVARGLILLPNKYVVVFDFKSNQYKIYTAWAFEDGWIKQNFMLG